jgi:hypothetical protein
VSLKEYLGYLWEDRRAIALAIVIGLLTWIFWE